LGPRRGREKENLRLIAVANLVVSSILTPARQVEALIGEGESDREVTQLAKTCPDFRDVLTEEHESRSAKFWRKTEELWSGI
jgi:hypothetical protein